MKNDLIATVIVLGVVGAILYSLGYRLPNSLPSLPALPR